MTRSAFLVTLALVAGILTFSIPTFAGYPEGADQTWEPWYKSWTDSSWVSPDPVFRPGDTEDRAIGGEIIRREVDSHYSGATSRLMPREEIPHIGEGEIIWSIDVQIVGATAGTLMYLDIETVDLWQPYHSPFFYPTEEWATYQFTAIPENTDDYVSEIVVMFESEWSGEESYHFAFDNLRFSQDSGVTWTVIESGGQPTGVNGDAPMSPAPTLALGQNFPNPFNPSTAISYTIAVADKVRLDVFDLAGRVIRTLVDGYQPAGGHTVQWDGIDNAGRPTASGVYFYRLETGSGSQSRSMLLMK